MRNLISLTAGMVLSIPKANADTENIYIKRAAKKYEKNKLQEAILDLDKAIKLNKKNDILIYIDANKKKILKKLKKRKNFNIKLFSKFKKIQLPLAYKKKKSNFIIKNNFTKKSIKGDINRILNKIL